MQLKGISIADLAKRLGVSHQAISKQMVHDLRVSKAKNIADALGVELAALFIPPKFDSTSTAKGTEIKCPKCGSKLEISLKAEELAPQEVPPHQISL